MCGRLYQTATPEVLQALFGTAMPLPNLRPRWNAAPTDDLAVVRYNPATGQRSLDPLRWGLVPLWAKDPSIGVRAINARAESVATQPLVRDAFARRRCLVPADGFYEWQKRPGGGKQAYAIAAADGRPLALAGLWERWKAPDGSILRSVVIVTTAANDAMRPIHERMPVILAPADWPRWLGQEPAPAEALAALLAPCPAEALRLWPIGPRVGNVRNDDPGLIEPAATDGMPALL